MKQRITNKRILPFFALLLTILVLLPVVVGAWKQPNQNLIKNYRDLDKNAWYYNSVNWCIANGLMSNGGDSKSFDPSGNVSRATFAKLCQNLIVGLERDITSKGELPFTDTKKGEWYVNSLSWAYENMIINGYGDGKIGPNDLVTREQIAVLLNNLVTEYFGVDLTGKETDLTTFKDAAKIDDWAEKAVSAMVAIGLYKGNADGNFNPLGKASRAEIATLFERLYRWYTVTPAAYLDKDIASKLIPTMLEEFDGEGKEGWNNNFWTNVSKDKTALVRAKDENNKYILDENGNYVYVENYDDDWQLSKEDLMYTEDGKLYMDILYPGEHDTADSGLAGLITGHDVDNKFSQAYGFYEIRIKLSDATGICTAWWLTTNANGYPGIGSPDWFIEMDMIETELNASSKSLISTMHDHGQDPNEMKDVDIADRLYVKGNKFKTERAEGDPYCLPDASMFDGQYHTVGYLWVPDGCYLYYDGNYVGKYSDTGEPLGKTPAEAGNTIHNSDLPAVLRLNTYYWGHYAWVDDVDINDFTKDKNGNLTSQSVVDYVRVYQLSDLLDDYAPNYYAGDAPAYYTDAVAALAK